MFVKFGSWSAAEWCHGWLFCLENVSVYFWFFLVNPVPIQGSRDLERDKEEGEKEEKICLRTGKQNGGLFLPPALKCESPGLFMRERRSKKVQRKEVFFCWRKLQCVSRILREEEVYERGAAPTKIKISQKVAQFLAPQKRPKSPLPPFLRTVIPTFLQKTWTKSKIPNRTFFSPRPVLWKVYPGFGPPPHVLT